MAAGHDEGEYGEPLKYDPDFAGPYRRRSCTDVICLFLFMVFIGCWIGIGLYAFVQGDKDVMLVPKDSRGSRCGFDSHVIDKPYLFFFDLTKCLQPVPFTGCQTPQVCVRECPNKMFLMDTSNNLNDVICVDDIRPRSGNEAQQLVRQGKCARWYLHSAPVQKRCLPSIGIDFDLSPLAQVDVNITYTNLEKNKENVQIMAKAEQIGSNVVQDIVKSWWKIAICLVIALCICIIYIVIMRWIAGIMVWLSILCVLVVLSFCIYYSQKQYRYYKDNPVQEQQASNALEAYLTTKTTWMIFLIISSVLLAVIVLVLIFLRKRITLAIALIEEASRAVSAVTSALFFPILPWCLQIGVITYAVSVGLYLSTIGDLDYKVKNFNSVSCRCTGEAVSYMKENATCDPSIFKSLCHYPGRAQPCPDTTCHLEGVNSPTLISYLQGVNIFGFFWLLFYISAMGEMMLAGTFASWYWTFKKSNVPFFTVTESILRTLRYHMGTLAFGSLIVAVCRMIRVVLEYIDSKLKKYENACTKVILCCCKCFCWCLENFIKFINRNAYIMCSIHGKNFCTSAKDAFSLLMRNVIRVVVLDKVTDFLLFLSKILVTAVVVCIAYLAFVEDYIDINQTELNYNLVPVIVIGIGTFFIATVFFSVFTMAVDTLFLCFLEDSERNDGSRERPYYMSRNLRNILGKKNK